MKEKFKYPISFKHLKNKMFKKITLLALVIFISLLTPLFSIAQVPDLYCGDGLCGGRETATNCEVDCRCVTEEIIIFYEPPEEREVAVEKTDEVTFFNRDLIIDQTCGVDANLDGLLCDPNEDWLVCSEDCPLPSLDSILCIGPNCIYKEAWFVRLLITTMGIVGVYLFVKSRR